MLTNTTDRTGEEGLRIRLLVAILLLSFIGTLLIRYRISAEEQHLQEGISDKIIRFHVIANSDSSEDQKMKYAVRDALVGMLSPELRDANSIMEGRSIITSMLSSIKNTAEEVLRRAGYQDPVSVSLTSSYFPMKVYGEYAFPPGMYEALQVKIGEAEGKNWWCIMFPPLCFVDETYSIVDGDSKEQLKCLLTEDEYNALRDPDIPVKIRFKLWDYVKKLFLRKE